MSPEMGGVLFVHAHPDDEVMATGGLIARLVSEGHRVDLVTCTDGAEGEIHDPDLDQEEARPRLAEIRRRELACAVEALGDGAVHQHFLGYRDSGMIGTEANDHPASFWKADLEEATRRLVEVVREARPAAIVTYDSNGNYGHPDHINAYRIGRAAYEAAGDAERFPGEGPGAPFAVERFYEIAFSRERWTELMTAMTERGIKLPWNIDESAAVGAAAVSAAAGEATEAESGDEAEGFGTPDELVTTRVDVSAYAGRKRAAMECHRTQRQDMGWLIDLPDDLAAAALATESFVLRLLGGAEVPSTHRENHVLG